MDESNRVNLYRINLKTDAYDRNELLDFCLFNPKEQFIAIGWSCVYLDGGELFTSYKKYYDAVKKFRQNQGKRMNAAHNIFDVTKENDLFWTRDTDGHYWICRAKSEPMPMHIRKLDIGAVVPVKAYLVGIDVPGGIKATFTRPLGGIAQRIYDEKLLKYSKHKYNQLSKENLYTDSVIENENLIDNLPDFELEELVIAYIQIKHNYYVLSNSIANKSTTPGIECILHSREKGNSDRAVVQVKGGRRRSLNAEDFRSYLNERYKVFLYSSRCSNKAELQDVVCITEKELIDFYKEYKDNLPESITRWEYLLD